MKIIGITGTLGAGKGTIVAHLCETYGFVHYSVRKFIQAEVEKRGIPVSRDTLIDMGNELRTNYHPGYIAEELYAEAQARGKDAIIESIRSVGEIDTLKSFGNFFLFAVDADPRQRYERILERASSTDRVTFEEFLAAEGRETGGTDPRKQNLRACMARADFLFNNDGALEELKRQVDEAVAKINGL